MNRSSISTLSQLIVAPASNPVNVFNVFEFGLAAGVHVFECPSRFCTWYEFDHLTDNAHYTYFFKSYKSQRVDQNKNENKSGKGDQPINR